MNRSLPPDPFDHLPADLAPLARAADRLATAEQVAAPAGLEARIAAATAPAPSLRLVRHDGPVIVVKRVRWAVRVAAAVALLVGGYGAYLVFSPASPAHIPGGAVATNESPIDVAARGLALLDAATTSDGLERALAEAEQLELLIQSDFIDPALLLGSGSL